MLQPQALRGCTQTDLHSQWLSHGAATGYGSPCLRCLRSISTCSALAHILPAVYQLLAFHLIPGLPVTREDMLALDSFHKHLTHFLAILLVLHWQPPPSSELDWRRPLQLLLAWGDLQLDHRGSRSRCKCIQSTGLWHYPQHYQWAYKPAKPGPELQHYLW